MSDIVILIPAAGDATRMRGRDKLLEPVDGLPLLARQVRVAEATGCAVLVTLRLRDKARHAALGTVNAPERIELPDAAEGIAASLRAGAAWAQARRAMGLMVLLADLPDLETGDLERLLAMFRHDPAHPIRATDMSGQTGHPVIFPARLFGALTQLSGDQGARAVLAQEKVVTLPLPDQRATTDLDTPEAWAEWRRHNPR
ncbi:MAG: nucleotidyltransferase family protein [Roseovarius sp.]|nr:nucleotidyltransferase family protein [Roseovarius sp.]